MGEDRGIMLMVLLSAVLLALAQLKARVQIHSVVASRCSGRPSRLDGTKSTGRTWSTTRGPGPLVLGATSRCRSNQELKVPTTQLNPSWACSSQMLLSLKTQCTWSWWSAGHCLKGLMTSAICSATPGISSLLETAALTGGAWKPQAHFHCLLHRNGRWSFLRLGK